MATYEIKISIDNLVENEEKGRTTARTIAGESVEKYKDKPVKKSSVAGLAEVNYAKNFARSAIHHEIGLIEIRTGQAKRQQQIEMAQGLLDRLVDIGESAATGALFAGGAGAIVGTAVGAARQGVQLAQAADTLNTQKAAEVITLQINSSRIYSEGNR